MMDLLFVRHGESVGNAEGRMQGHLDFPLSERGRQQATRLGAWLVQQGITWDVALCSPLRRAHETATILTQQAGLAAPEPSPDLREIAAGSLEGLTRDEMLAEHPSFLQREVTELGDFAEYGGESYEAVQARVDRIRARLEAQYRESAQRVLLVGHGGFHFQLLKRLVCLPVPRVAIFRIGNCTTTLVRMRERRGTYLGEIVWHVPLELTGAEPSGEGTSALFR